MAPPKPKRKEIRVLVTGGRDYADRERVFKELDKHLKEIVLVVHGACPTGADKFAEEWAKDRCVPVVSYPAQWDLYGRQAGPYRNAYMIGEQEPTLALAFPGGAGTADCVRKLKAHKIPVLEVS